MDIGRLGRTDARSGWCDRDRMVMGVQHYLSCLWPGLSELWWRGRLSALPAAVAFGVGLNSYLVLRFLFPTWLDPILVRSGFWVGVVVWGYWTIKSIRELPVLIAPREASESPDTFPEAQMAYLRRDWEQAESLLLDALRVEPRDPPALLLLSSVYRELGRPQHSLALLAEISRLEVGDHWHIELEAERGRAERLAEEQSEQEIDEQDTADADTTDADTTEEPNTDRLNAAGQKTGEQQTGEQRLQQENFSDGSGSNVAGDPKQDANGEPPRRSATSGGGAAEMTAA